DSYNMSYVGPVEQDPVRDHEEHTMRIVIFGANGPTGRLLTRLSLTAGYDTVAVTRQPGTFGVQDPRPRVAGADVLDADAMAGERPRAALRAAAGAIVGADADHTGQVYRRIQAVAAPETTIASGLIGDSSATDRVFSPFEVACLDIQGRAAGRPVADLLGGAV